MARDAWKRIWQLGVLTAIGGGLYKAAEHDEKLRTGLAIAAALGVALVLVVYGPPTYRAVSITSVSASKWFCRGVKLPAFKMRVGIVLCLIGIGLPLAALPWVEKIAAIPPLLSVVGIVGFLCGLGLILFALVDRHI